MHRAPRRFSGVRPTNLQGTPVQFSDRNSHRLVRRPRLCRGSKPIGHYYLGSFRTYTELITDVCRPGLARASRQTAEFERGSAARESAYHTSRAGRAAPSDGVGDGRPTRVIRKRAPSPPNAGDAHQANADDPQRKGSAAPIGPCRPGNRPSRGSNRTYWTWAAMLRTGSALYHRQSPVFDQRQFASRCGI
ncbi:hypothetical protein BH09GEM1_BH09GEM1_03160 [soil metagenome]